MESTNKLDNYAGLKRAYFPERDQLFFFSH